MPRLSDASDQFLYFMESGSSVQQIRTLNYIFNSVFQITISRFT